MKTLRTLKISPNAPDTNSVWLYKGTMKYFNNGEWETIKGESEPYTLPAATKTSLGGVLGANNVADIAANGSISDVITKFNMLLSNLRKSGVIIT